MNFGNLSEHRKINPTGRGLGLSICKLIIEKMGGTVKVISKLDVGTIFRITFRTLFNFKNP
jgi:signal transduction histidine kinase